VIGMSEFNQDDNGGYRNSHNPNWSRGAIYGYEQYPRGRRGGGRGSPWLTAALVLAAFLAGALTVRYLPVFQPNTQAQTAGPSAAATATPGLAAAMVSAPQTSPPALGGEPVAAGQNSSIPAIAKAVGPAVVGVVNKAAGGFPWGGPGSASGGEQAQSTGSGVIISADGYIVTNNHVISGADSVSVTLPGGAEVDAQIVGADEQTDLAVLKIAETGLTAAPIGNSDLMEVGQSVIAIGNPLGEELAGTVTMGILSARDRELVVDGYKFKFFQTDAAINPGNSGGALVNTAGELIGINSSKSTSAGVDEYGNNISAEGIGFAIPINDAMPIIQQLIADGYIPRPMLGIEVTTEISERMARYYDVPQGIYLRSVTPGGPLDRAGVREGDILTEIGGTAVTSIAGMNAVLSEHKVGDTLQVKVWRDGRGSMTLDVTLDGKTK
jgi:serine protease Do